MPKPPPRDQDGKIISHDHPDILDEHYVIRHTTQQDLCDDDGGKRLSSGAFSESEGGGMSVDIEDWMKIDGLPPLHYITDPTHGAVRLNVGDLRKQKLQVGWDPDNAHPHHGGVWGIGNGSKRKRRVLEIATSLKQWKARRCQFHGALRHRQSRKRRSRVGAKCLRPKPERRPD